jgi:iron(III) transport system permease protein
MRHLMLFVLPHAATQTLMLLCGVAVFAGAMGIISAWLVTMFRFKGRGILLWLLPLPLAVPTYITAYSYVEIFEPLGVVQSTLRSLFGWSIASTPWFPEVRSLPSAVIIMSSVVYPYVYLAARVMFATQSASLLEAARTMGASHLQMVRLVALPLARPALAVGLSLALLEVLNDVGASEYLGVRTLTLTIMNTWLNTGNLAGAALIALILLMLVLGLMSLESHGRLKQRYGSSLRKPRTPSAISVEGLNALWLATACFIPPLLGFILPLSFLIHESIERSLLTGLDHTFWHYSRNSLILALITTLILVPIGFILAFALRQTRTQFASFLMKIAHIGYAMPGTVLALGLMLPFALGENGLRWVFSNMGYSITMPLIMGTMAALVIAYVIRFQSLATGGISAGFERISPHLDMAARTLGSTSHDVMRQIHVPLLLGAMASAGLMVFVDTLKELPATLLLRPLNGETLATQLYAYASQGQFEQGAPMALMIVLIGLIPVIVLTYLTARHVKGRETPSMR